MTYVIYNSKQAAIDREQQLTDAGVRAGYWKQGERYDIGGLLIDNPTEDKAAIQIFKMAGIVTPLSQNDILPLNCEPLFTAEELAGAVDALGADWNI